MLRRSIFDFSKEKKITFSKPKVKNNHDEFFSLINTEKYMSNVFGLQGITSRLLLAVLAAISGTSFHFGYASGVM